MTEEPRKNWRDLCCAVTDSKDPNELLELVTELNLVLEHEEQGRRDLRKQTSAPKLVRRDNAKS